MPRFVHILLNCLLCHIHLITMNRLKVENSGPLCLNLNLFPDTEPHLHTQKTESTQAGGGPGYTDSKRLYLFKVSFQIDMMS